MWDIPQMITEGLGVAKRVLTRLWPEGQTREESALLDELKHWEEEHAKAMRPNAPDPDHASFARQRMRLVRDQLRAVQSRKG